MVKKIQMKGTCLYTQRSGYNLIEKIWGGKVKTCI